MASSRRFLTLLLLGAAGCSAVGCGSRTPNTGSPPPAQAAWFEDVTAELGLDFQHDPGPVDGKYFMPQINGSGAALFDFDNDGRLDIYLLQFGGANSAARNALFRQLPTGKLENVSAGSGLDIAGQNLGVAVGDINNDGQGDVVVTQYEDIKFFLNQGGGKFADATEQSALQNPNWGAAASFLDYDRDGWLDLVVVNYLEFEVTRSCDGFGGKRDFCIPVLFAGSPSRLHHNRGVDPQGNWLGFEDCTAPAGLESKPGRGMGVVCADFNGDQWPDILIANDLQPNYLWINKHDGTFVEEGVLRGIAMTAFGAPASNMGTAYGDVDGDGRCDLFVTHFTDESHTLWKQGAPGMFSDQSIATGLTRTLWRGTGWGTVLADFDQDGALDIALTNGYVRRRGPPTDSFWQAYVDRNQILANDGRGKFRDISESNPAFCGTPNVGRGLCMGDIDGDGALDLLVTQIAGPAKLFRNVAPQRGHWLLVRAIDGRRDAIGAELQLRSTERTWQGLVQPSQSFECSHDPRVHFGLGNTDHVESLDVVWANGDRERFPVTAVDKSIVVQRGQGQPLPASEHDSP